MLFPIIETAKVFRKSSAHFNGMLFFFLFIGAAPQYPILAACLSILLPVYLPACLSFQLAIGR